MPKFSITFARPATVWYSGTIEVEAEDEDAAQNTAENLLMQGAVDMQPDLQSAEYDRDYAATIEHFRQLP